MKHFTDGQSVTVNGNHFLQGKTGKVTRMCRSFNLAWVRMDQQLPTELESFPSGDPRHHDILLYPDECDAVRTDVVKP